MSIAPVLLRLVVLLAFGGFCGIGPVRADSPGTIVSETPIDGAPAGARAWRVVYRSIAESGAMVDVSGIVVAPVAPAPKAGRDIVTWAHATVGIAESCGPSERPDVFQNIAGLADMIAAGYVVTATDFQGLGTPGPHPYLVGVSSGRAMLDAVRAARAIAEAQAGRRYLVWGESQGAHASLWAAQLAPTYLPGLKLMGVAAAAPPTDLPANFDAITNPLVKSLMTGFTSEAWSRVYGLKLATFANAAGRAIIRQLATDCVHINTVSAFRDTGFLLLSQQIPKHLGEPWTKPLHDNSLYPMRLGVPMLIAQGTADEVVIPSVTRSYFEGACRVGNVVKWLPIEGGDHTTIAARSKDATLPWIADRFAGRPAPSDCDSIVSSDAKPRSAGKT